MARKSPSFGQLIAYIDAPQHGPALTHNLRSAPGDTEAIHREFLDNARYLPPRKNGNVLYHEVLSFSDLDRQKLTPEVFEDLTRKYLEFRAPYALGYAGVHLDTECPHVHIMLSANNFGAGRRLRLSRAEFSRIKHTLEKHQREQYPFLENSIVYESVQSHAKGRSRIRQRRKESERARRLNNDDDFREPSQKEKIRNLLSEQFVVARSAKGLFLRLKVLGLHLYRRGRHFAVHDLAGRAGGSGAGRRYRLETLGLADVFQNALEQWKTLHKRLLALDAQQLARAQELWDGRGFGAQMLEVSALHSSELSPLERDRLEQIQSVRRGRENKELDSPERSL